MSEQETKKAVVVPSVQDLLQAGTHFGHEVQRWNPKMKKYIYAERGNIHIIDVSKTHDSIKKAVDFLQKVSSTGNVLFVGTKKQSSDLVRDLAIKSKSHFVNTRWVGGLLTNFAIIKASLAKLITLERAFDEGIEDRTKYEVSLMKKEWQRLNRLFAGLKTLNAKPVAVIILDINYEKSALKEAKKIGIPIVGIVDTNSDPELVDYPIPANDDAMSSIQILLNTLADAVISGNNGKGVEHKIGDYSNLEIKITKKQNVEDISATKEVLAILSEPAISEQTFKQKENRAQLRASKERGILERVKEDIKPTKLKKTEKAKPEKSNPKVKKTTPKNTRKESSKPTKKTKK